MFIISYLHVHSYISATHRSISPLYKKITNSIIHSLYDIVLLLLSPTLSLSFFLSLSRFTKHIPSYYTKFSILLIYWLCLFYFTFFTTHLHSLSTIIHLQPSPFHIFPALFSPIAIFGGTQIYCKMMMDHLQHKQAVNL